MITTFVNTKGGVAKSTLCSHIVLALFDRGYRVSLLDADVLQRSSSNWIKKAEPGIPVVVESDPEEIRVQLRELSACSDVVVADTPGHDGAAAHAAVMHCDLAVVPLQPSKLDVRAIRAALEYIFLARRVSGGNKPEGRIILTHTNKGEVLARELRKTIVDSIEIPVMQTEMRRLTPFQHSPDSSVLRMKGKDAKNAGEDINAIVRELFSGRLPGLDSPLATRAVNE